MTRVRSDGDNSRRKRDNEYSTARKKRWSRYYRDRMVNGLEFCRLCESTTDLRFGHIIPHSKGGKFSQHNLTITCERCEKLIGSNEIVGVKSLWHELNGKSNVDRKVE